MSLDNEKKRKKREVKGIKYTDGVGVEKKRKEKGQMEGKQRGKGARKGVDLCPKVKKT